MSNRKSRDDAKAQHERFIETARQLGCDEDEAAFRDKLRVIAQQKPKDERTAPRSSPKKTVSR